MMDKSLKITEIGMWATMVKTYCCSNH